LGGTAGTELNRKGGPIPRSIATCFFVQQGVSVAVKAVLGLRQIRNRTAWSPRRRKRNQSGQLFLGTR